MRYILFTSLLACLFLIPFAQVRNVETVGFTVKEMERSIKFYTEVLHFKKISDTEVYGREYEKLLGVFGLRIRIVRLQLGDETLELTDFLTTGGRDIPGDQKSNDLYFQHIAIVVSDMDKAYEQLRQYNVGHVSTGPQTLPKSIVGAEGIKAFYFRDPDNHNLEIIYFPVGKGQPKWQQAEGNIFLGIDHTAIGISSTDRSHNFYSGLLGIAKKGDSWNKGDEQAHLNNIKDASLHITGYHSDGGPGVEFLEYLVPGPGRPYPKDSRSDDIWHWQTTVIVRDADKLFEKLKSQRIQFISSDLITLNIEQQKKYHAFMVRDPDGHAVLIKEPLY